VTFNNVTHKLCSMQQNGYDNMHYAMPFNAANSDSAANWDSSTILDMLQVHSKDVRNLLQMNVHRR